MAVKAVIILLLVVYVAINVITSAKFNAEEMVGRYWQGQCAVGRVAATVFYAPAYLTKGIKLFILRVVK